MQVDRGCSEAAPHTPALRGARLRITEQSYIQTHRLTRSYTSAAVRIQFSPTLTARHPR
jgi:hypothetical protein